MSGDSGEPPSPGRIRGWAFRYLGRFASTRANLVRVLQRKAMRVGAELEVARLDPLLDELGELGLLDDAAFASRRVQKLQAGGRSAPRLRATLTRRGVTQRDADRALADYDEMAAAIAFARKKRLGPFRAGEADRMAETVVMRRAGFSPETTRTILAAADVDELIGNQPT